MRRSVEHELLRFAADADVESLVDGSTIVIGSSRKARAASREWYRRNWKSVVAVWGTFLALIAAMGLILWLMYWSHTPPPHVHVVTGLQVVEPSADYERTTCVVCGEPLPALADRVAVLYQGSEVQFSCENCLPKFEADPQKYLTRSGANSK